jgi:cation transport regulator ChaB
VPGREELPSTVERSSRKAQETWVKTHDSAVETYGEGERAHRTAFAALKHSFEKVGDHWEQKAEKGPSDDQAARAAADPEVPTASGVDANASKAHLYGLARRLDVAGRSRMSKGELVAALRRANEWETRRDGHERASQVASPGADGRAMVAIVPLSV